MNRVWKFLDPSEREREMAGKKEDQDADLPATDDGYQGPNIADVVIELFQNKEFLANADRWRLTLEAHWKEKAEIEKKKLDHEKEVSAASGKFWRWYWIGSLVLAAIVVVLVSAGTAYDKIDKATAGTLAGMVIGALFTQAKNKE